MSILKIEHVDAPLVIIYYELKGLKTMQEVSINWKGIAQFLGIPNATEEQLKKIPLNAPYDHLEVIGVDKLKRYVPPTIRPTPHNPGECEFCAQMAQDDLAKAVVK